MIRKPTMWTIRAEFISGKSCIGLARKYGMTSLKIQSYIRRAERKLVKIYARTMAAQVMKDMYDLDEDR